IYPCLCRENKQVRRLTSAATRRRFMKSFHDFATAHSDHKRWGETSSIPDLPTTEKLGLDGVSPHPGSSHCAVQDSARNLSGIEVVFGKLPRGAAVMLVVGVNGFERTGGLPGRGKSKHSLAIGKKRARPRVLHNHGFAAGQITDGAIANPGGLQFDIGRFRATELAARTLDMGLVILEVVGNFARVSDAPPAALQIALLHQVALRSEKQRQL